MGPNTRATTVDMGGCCVSDGRPGQPSNGADGLRRSDATYEPEETRDAT